MSDTNGSSPNPVRSSDRPGRPVRPVGDSVQQHIKTAVHKELIKRIDLDKLAEIQETRGAQQQFFNVIQSMVNEQGVPLSATERDRLAQEVVDEVFGLGPLEPLLKDDTISDILVNTYSSIYVERRCVSRTTSISCTPSTRSFRRSAGASTSRPPWWMPVFQTALVSTSSFRRW